MNVIFLRGAVPPASEHPEKLLYNSIKECEDVWTQLFYYYLFITGSKGELLYDGGNRTFKKSDYFTERWVKSIGQYKPSFKPDLIICRGGFKYYDPFVARFPDAKKVYYGAGKRFFPSGFDDYDLFLTDSKKQLDVIRKKGKNVKLLLKPASTLFTPVPSEKKYHICFIANASQASIKRHELFINAFAGTKYKILSLGNIDKRYIKMARKAGTNIAWGGWSLRKDLPSKISQCEVGVCCSTDYDSCPRVIPEYLACGLPVVATNNMNFWVDKYITPETGMVVPPKKLAAGVKKVLDSKLSPHDYYGKNLSMPCAVKHLADIIGAIL